MAWLEIKECDGLYQINEEGRIRRTEDCKRLKKYEELKTRVDQYGFVTVGLWKNGLQITRRVHRLVYEAFHGYIPEGHEFIFLDGDKTNTSLSNLKPVMPEDNENRDWGDRESVYVLTDDEIREIKNRFEDGEPPKKLAEDFNITLAYVYALANEVYRKGV